MLSDADILSQVLAAFQEEQVEHRQAAGELLLELERSPEHPQRQALLDQLFREAHSLKGGARAAGLSEVEQIAHRIEDLFSAVRQGHLALTPTVCDPVYAALDAIGALMEQVAAGEALDLLPYTDLLATLAQVSQTSQRDGMPAPTAALAPTATPAPNATPTEAEHVAAPIAADSAGERVARDPGTIRIATASLDTLLNEAGELITCSLRGHQHARNSLALADLASRWRRVWRQTRPVYERLSARAPLFQPAVHYLEGRAALPVSDPSAPDHEVGVLLDALREANTLLNDLEQRLGQQGRQIREDSTELTAVTERIHEQVRRARMLPLTTIVGPLRLQVREMARAAGKQVRLELDDGAAEADRDILERLREALLHLLRNAIDHGIEPPEQRVACGKPAEGSIVLSATVVGDQLLITLSDDGGGLDLAAIARRAMAGGHMSESDVARMSSEEIAQLIFLPGLSTRITVSALSGRGVGLDIVRSHIAQMRGRVSVQSEPGRGCRFNLNLPCSLTRAHGLLIQAGAARYALPLDAVQQLVAVAPSDIQLVEGRAALVREGRPLPLAHLADLLGSSEAAPGGRAAGSRVALLLGTDERQVACLIDAVLGEQELIAQRLPPPIQTARFVAAATILHDGAVVPILDVNDLIGAALGATRSEWHAPASEAPPHAPVVLVVDDSITTRTLEKNILEAAGYQVRLATDGVEALALLDQLTHGEGCDLLLSDVDMPRLNGFELTAQLRASTRYATLPIVLVTSLDSPSDRERGIAAGADAYIVKRGFDQQTLLETIATFLA
ncbi:MAG TPA: hybrid sensor histidine kinase/response regulator [Roseiflexaceae bacterium]|nr:hybrid sensor histidine kinase/response regulator [Roseiflexaceae bacterium]